MLCTGPGAMTSVPLALSLRSESLRHGAREGGRAATKWRPSAAGRAQERRPERRPRGGVDKALCKLPLGGLAYWPTHVMAQQRASLSWPSAGTSNAATGFLLIRCSLCPDSTLHQIPESRRWHIPAPPQAQYRLLRLLSGLAPEGGNAERLLHFVFSPAQGRGCTCSSTKEEATSDEIQRRQSSYHTLAI